MWPFKEKPNLSQTMWTATKKCVSKESSEPVIWYNDIEDIPPNLEAEVKKLFAQYKRLGDFNQAFPFFNIVIYNWRYSADLSYSFREAAYNAYKLLDGNKFNSNEETTEPVLSICNDMLANSTSYKFERSTKDSITTITVFKNSKFLMSLSYNYSGISGYNYVIEDFPGITSTESVILHYSILTSESIIYDDQSTRQRAHLTERFASLNVLPTQMILETNK